MFICKEGFSLYLDSLVSPVSKACSANCSNARYFFAVLCFRPTEWACYLAYLPVFLDFLNFLLLRVL